METYLAGINTRCIGLGSRDQTNQSKTVKLGRVYYHARLLDLHRSNPFSPNLSAVSSDIALPETWYVAYYVLHAELF